MRQHDRVVVLRARAEPAAVAERAGALELGLQLGRDADGLLVVAARDADDAGLERFARVRLLERAQLLEQLAERRVDAPLVRGRLYGRALLRARLGTGRGHLRLFVPAEERPGPHEIVDSPEPPEELVEPVVQAPRVGLEPTTLRLTAGCSAN